MEFASGQILMVRQQQLMGTNGLRHVLLGHDGTTLPSYSRAALDQIVARLV